MTTAVVPKMSYKDMITDAIVSLKERNGSSRQALKKYIQSNHSITVNFDNHFNNALKKGVMAGIFAQPKGPSGPVKIVKTKPEPAAKKEKIVKVAKPTKKVAKKPVGSKGKKELKAAPKKATTTLKKATKATKAATPKKAVKGNTTVKKAAPKKVTKAAPKKTTKKAAKK